MAQEIELKLEVSQCFAAYLNQQLSNFTILRQKQSALGNVYYDTDERFFANQKMGLRVRSEDNRYTMTLKTNGKVLGGLHIRPEYNVELSQALPDLEKLCAAVGKDIPLPQAPLNTLFSTDFIRSQWLIEFGNGTEIEVALDQGKIIAEDKRAVINEVEFELKQGNLQDLFHFVKRLTLTDGIRLSAVSKAQRGYYLLDSELNVQDWLEKWRVLLELGQHPVRRIEVLTALLQYEQQLIEETIYYGADYFAQDFLCTVERIGAFFNLYHYYVGNVRLFTALFNEQESNNVKIKIDENLLQNIVESNQYLLTHIQSIITLHSETKDNRLAMGKLIETLYLGNYVNRLLDFIQLML